MVFISRLRLRNFKSFKAADVELSPTFVCFAGPNGSGKSNLCDAIRFSMGETSLKSLRAKKVKELIHAGSRSAEVTLVFDSNNGGKGYEIKRVIREDGKILYKLNGKKTTRGTILETLKRDNLDESGRNTIAQGEVAKIISMNGKERRMIIDSVAGIADFEEKKKEALRELDLVETRIKEGQLVLGERKVYLDDLGREKESAIQYRDAKRNLANAKGTLLKAEIAKLERDLEKEMEKEKKFLEEKEESEKQLDEINERIRKVEIERTKTSDELRKKQKTNEMIRRIEELKAACGSKEQLIEDKNGFIDQVKVDLAKLAKEIEDESASIAATEKEIASLAKELRDAEARFSSEIGTVEDEGLREIKQRIEEKEKDLSSSREKLIALNSEIESKKEIMEAKGQERESIAPGEEEEAEDTKSLQKQVDRIAKEIDRSFARTKEINAEMADLDRRMLELKEKASIFKVRASPQLANPALSFINDLKGKDKGIHGTFADLISFDQRYAHAVEAAGGARLLYVVVDSVDTATRAIEKLKKAKAGRATFIPLDSVKAPPPLKTNGFSSVLEVVDFPARIQRAAHYVFAETLLVNKVSDAKSVGIGKARMVTLDGEIFERSGIVSGGRAQSGILSANQLRKIEKDLSDVRSTKESLLQDLYSIREEESRLRAEKSQVEIKIKTAEMKASIAEENRNALKRKEQLAGEISGLERLIQEKAKEREAMEKLAKKYQEELQKLKERLAAAEEEFSKQSQESSEKRAELSGAVSSLRATIEGKRNEVELRKEELAEKEKRVKKLKSDEKESAAKITETRKQMKEEQKELAGLEERISSTSKAIEKLFETMKGHEDELQAIGEERGKVRLNLDKVVKDLNQLEIKKATTSTRLEDIRAESVEEFEEIEAGRDELTRMIAESERTLGSLGNVNMAAIEMYDKKKQEIEEVEGRIGKLDKEREAILLMINEIEEHKKEAFFETFEAVSDNFRKMFKYVDVGEGHLYLNNPSKPFESGLFIKLRRKNQEHSLDALSGGEKTLVALMFIFALQMFKPAPFYILDEVDAALDKPNSKNLSDLVTKMSKDSQFIIVSHNDIVMANSNTVIGVTKSGDVSKLVGIKLKQVVHA